MAKTFDIVRSFIGVGITMGLAILFIIMYVNHKDQHCDKKLQLWLLVMGISQVASTILTVTGFLTIYSHAKDEAEEPLHGGEKKTTVGQTCMGCLVCLFGLFLLAWFIVGNVWTFSMSPNTHGEKCNRTVYLLCFWYIISCYIMTAVFCVFGCLFACCFLRKQ